MLCAALSVPAFSQTGMSAQADAVRSLTGELSKRSSKASVLTRALVFRSGKVIKSTSEWFDLKSGKHTVTIKHDDVLEMSGGGKSLSFVPDAPQQHHGTWEDVGHIYPNTKIVIILTDGKAVKAFANSATPTRLVVIERERYERWEVERDRVEAVYGLIGGYGGVKANASKGAEAMNASRDKLLGGILTGAAALAGLVKSDGRPILVYSK